MPRPPLALDIDRGRGPVYLRIAAAVIDAICEGRLRAGELLPGTRALAHDLGVNRNTVKAAFVELASQGWVQSRPSSGTAVSRELPEGASAAAPMGRAAARASFPLPHLPLPPADIWAHLAGVDLAFVGADTRLTPGAALARAYRHALSPRHHAALGYRIERGHPRLLTALSQRLATSRGLSSQASLLITRGSQNALYLILRALLERGDTVAVEDPGYAQSWPAFRAAGLELVGVPVDKQGMRVDALAALTKRRRVRGVMTTPHLQYPTGATLAPARREQLLALARQKRVLLIEDDWVHDVRYEGKPVLPLAAQDPSGSVLYLGSFSKAFAPALRLGFVVGPEDAIERLARMRALVDVCGDGALELAMAELIEDGEVDRHGRRLARIYRRRRDALLELLERRLGSVLRFERPRGGSALWAEVDPDIDVERWAEAGLREGVGFLTGRHFFLDARPHPAIWLGFGGLDERRLATGVARMETALRRAR